MTHNSEAVANIEGPYWDYVEASKYAARQCHSYAELCAEALLREGAVKARHWAKRYAEADALRDRISARYDQTKNEDFVWIGWSAQTEAGRWA